MKFQLVDKIELIEPARRIVTIKALSLAEEYLADHFPAFPVLPGVLMLEALVESAAWLVRLAQDFANSIVVLASAQNIRYSNFGSPGKWLRCEVEALSIGESAARFKACGFVCEPGAPQGRQAVSGRLELRCYNLAQRYDYLADADAAIVAELKRRFELVGGPAALAAGTKGCEA